MTLRAAGTYPGDFGGVDLTSADPLQTLPAHDPYAPLGRRESALAVWTLASTSVLTQLLGVEPLAVQTMLYFKPAGARGQALHQDNFYLRVQPGTCMAAWLALGSLRRGQRLYAGRSRQSRPAPALPTKSRHHPQLHRCHRARPGPNARLPPFVMNGRRRPLLQRKPHPRKLSQHHARPIPPLTDRPLHRGKRRASWRILPSRPAHGRKHRGAGNQRRRRPLRRLARYRRATRRWR